MKSLSLAAALLALASLGLAQPRISIDKPKIDLGVIYNGEVKQARVHILNLGKDTLRILGVNTSCGCTTARMPKGFLKPGESDEVDVEFNSAGFRGQIEKHINIQTNDPRSPTTTVTMTGDVIEELQPVNNGSVIWLGAVPVGKRVEQTVEFKNVSGKVMTLLGYKSSSPDVTVTFGKRTVLPADTIRFSVQITPKKAQYISEQLLLETDSKKQSQVPVRVTLLGVTPN